MTLGRADRDLVGLSVLALLLAGPKHTYEMHRMMVDTRKDFVTGLPRSMYHAVERLEKAGHISPVESFRDGRKPERTVFAVTDLGADVVRKRIERLLSTPDGNSTLFTAALSFLSCLPPERAADALVARRDALELRIEQIEEDLSQIPAYLPRVLLIETEHELASTRSELAWVELIRGEIDAGVLSWPADVSELANGIAGEKESPT